MNNHSFVIDTIISQIREGMLLHKPVIYLQTSEIEIVRRVLNSDRIVVRMTRRPRGKDERDVVMPFAKAHPEGTWHGALIDCKIINMDCCQLRELPGKICAQTAEWYLYGRFDFPHSNGDPKQGPKTQNLLPALLAVHVNSSKASASSYQDKAAFDALFPFIDRYAQEEEGSAIRSSVVLLFGEPTDLPSWLLPYCYIVEEPYPSREEIAGIIREKLKASGYDEELDKNKLETYISGFLGNTLIQVENTVDYLLGQPCDPLTGVPMLVEEEKKVTDILEALKEQNVKKSGLLELRKKENGGQEETGLGGMKAFYRWLHNNRDHIREAEQIKRRTGAAAQKGILMCGIPGCGKSAAVEVLSKELGLRVLEMNIGRLMGGIVGESEHNMDRALKLAEAMAPCILYIDEIEKGFSGSGGKGEDTSGVTKRMFGILLSWMQDCKKPVYLFATANSLAGIPKEFFRSGRFDSHFALYMPTYRECIDILKQKMRDAENNVKSLFTLECYNDQKLGGVINHLLTIEEDAEKSRGRFVTGADITKIVNMALRTFSDRNGPISHTDWIGALINAENETTVYGEGNENLDSIAMCYLRMMRLGFRPTSDPCLFKPKDYSVRYEEEKPVPSIHERTSFDSDYDRILYRTIYEKMLFLAKRLEENALQELLR